jgi:hypothetical protein
MVTTLPLLVVTTPPPKLTVGAGFTVFNAGTGVGDDRLELVEPVEVDTEVANGWLELPVEPFESPQMMVRLSELLLISESEEGQKTDTWSSTFGPWQGTSHSCIESLSTLMLSAWQIILRASPLAKWRSPLS